jgi:hypothetical protein
MSEPGLELLVELASALAGKNTAARAATPMPNRRDVRNHRWRRGKRC